MRCSAACPACLPSTASRTNPKARTVPGLLLYRFEANLVFFNVDYFGDRLRTAIAASRTPVEWVIIDASPMNWVDATAVQRLDELRSEQAGREIMLGVAQAKFTLGRAFDPNWVSLASTGLRRFPTLKTAVHAFEKHYSDAEAEQRAQGPAPIGSKADEPV